MGTYTRSHSFTSGEKPTEAQWNVDIDGLITLCNGQIDKANVDSSSTDGIVTMDEAQTVTGRKTFSGNLAAELTIDTTANAAGSVQDVLTLEWDPGDGATLTDNTSGIALKFVMSDDNAARNQDDFAALTCMVVSDASGSEEGEFSFQLIKAGTLTEIMTLAPTTGLTVGVDGTGYDVKFFGDTSGQYVLWDESADELVLAGDSKLSFHDAAGGENIIASADGHLEVNAGTTLDMTAPTIDVNASTAVTVDTDTVTFASANSTDPLVTIKNTTNDANGARLRFVHDKGGAGADNDVAGLIEFYGDDDNQDNILFAKIEGIVADASNGDECGKLAFYVAENDGTNTAGLTITGSTTDGEVDVGIGAGTSSVTTVAGAMVLTTVAAAGTDTDKFLVLDSSGNVDYRTGTQVLSDIGGTSGGATLTGSTDNTIATVTGANALAGEANLTYDGTDFKATSSTASKPIVSIENTHADATAGYLKFIKDPGSGQGADADIVGTITFYGTDAGNNAPEEFGRIESYVVEADHGSEAGGMKFYVAENDATATVGLHLAGQATADGEIDVTIGAGAASTTTVAGNLVVTGATSFGDANITNVGDIALDTISSDAGTSIGITLGTDAGDDLLVGTDKLVVEGDTGNVGIGTTAPADALHIVGAAGAISGITNQGSTQVVIENNSTNGLAFNTKNDSYAQISNEDDGGNQRQYIIMDHGTSGIGIADAIAFGTAGTGNRLVIGSAGLVAINATSNADMTVGLTINQGTNDDEIFALQSNDIDHGIDDYTHEKTYFYAKKYHATQGAAQLTGLSDTGQAIGLELAGIAGTPSTANAQSSTFGVVNIDGRKKNGTSTAACAATENVFVVANSGGAEFVIKGNGDIHATDTTMAGLDVDVETGHRHDDVGMIRAYQRTTHSDIGIAISKWDESIRANREDLRRVGVIRGDFVCLQRMNALLGGGIWQNYERIMDTREQLQSAMDERDNKIALLEQRLNQLEN